MGPQISVWFPEPLLKQFNREAHEVFLSSEVAEISRRPYGEGPRLGRWSDRWTAGSWCAAPQVSLRPDSSTQVNESYGALQEWEGMKSFDPKRIRWSDETLGVSCQRGIAIKSKGWAEWMR